MRTDRLFTIGVILLVVGLLGMLVTGASMWRSGRLRPGGWGPMMRGWRGYSTASSFTSNGQRIYYTATDDAGTAIDFSGGPMWLRMHGGGCVTCHGEDGKGGIEVPMTGRVSPDIRYHSLVSETHMEAGMEHPPYTDALIKRAITQGKNPAGHALSSAMPRWQMSDRDLNDLISYLKTL